MEICALYIVLLVACEIQPQLGANVSETTTPFLSTKPSPQDNSTLQASMDATDKYNVTSTLENDNEDDDDEDEEYFDDDDMEADEEEDEDIEAGMDEEDDTTYSDDYESNLYYDDYDNETEYDGDDNNTLNYIEEFYTNRTIRHKKGKRPMSRAFRPPRPPLVEQSNSTAGNWRVNMSQRPLSPEEKLLDELFLLYTPDARAGIDSSQTVTAHVQYTLMRIRKLDERTQVFTTAGLVITEWEDIRLRWNPEDYGNVTDLVVPPYYVWLPELTLMNAAEHMTQDFDKMGVLISHTGKIHWEPGGIFSTTCDMDITFFPFDNQKCSIIVGTWAYYSQRLNLTNATSEVSLHDYTEHGEWEILRTEVTWGETTLPCCPDVSYPYVMSTLKLKRRTLYYFMNIIIPCIMLSALVLVGFCIPTEAGEKISCGISVLLAFTVFLLMVSECIPRTSLQVPIIVVYLTCTMLLGTLSMAMSIAVLNIHFSHENEKVPKWVEKYILNGLACILCMPVNRDDRESNSQRDAESDLSDTDSCRDPTNPSDGGLHSQTYIGEPEPNKENAFRILGKKAKRLKCFSCKKGRRKMTKKRRRSVPYEWREVTRVLDRLFFVIVAILMILSTVLTLYAPVYAAPDP